MRGVLSQYGAQAFDFQDEGFIQVSLNSSALNALNAANERFAIGGRIGIGGRTNFSGLFFQSGNFFGPNPADGNTFLSYTTEDTTPPIAAVPVPATAGLMGLGLLGIFAGIRGRRREQGSKA